MYTYMYVYVQLRKDGRQRKPSCCYEDNQPRSPACPLRLTPVFKPHTNKYSHTYRGCSETHTPYNPHSLWMRKSCSVCHGQHKDVIKTREEGGMEEKLGWGVGGGLLHLSQVRLGLQGHRSRFPSPRRRAEEAAGTEKKKKKQRKPQ